MKILVIEDDAKMAGLLSRVLREESYVVEAFGSGAEGLAALEVDRPDVIVLDRMLPDGDGLHVCREARRRSFDVPILMLTARGELADKVAGFESGADDYLPKPFEVDELLARIGALVRRTHRQITVGSLQVDLQRRKISGGKQPAELTARELDVLVHLARSGGQVVSRAALLAAIWGTSMDPGTNLVEVHVSRVRTKLGAEAWRIETVRGEGYRLNLDGPR
jgi:DNA-binding response OmpR family regulator